MPLLTEKGFGAPEHQRRNFNGFISIHYAVPPYSARISAIYRFPFAKFGWVPFAVCNAWQRSRTQNFQRVSENFGPILNRLWTKSKVHKIVRRCRRPLVLSNALIRLSMSRFVQKLFAIKSRNHRKSEQM